MTDTEPVSIEVTKDSDIVLAGKLTESLSESMGFDTLSIEELTIVSKELASNIVKHADAGRLTITPIYADEAVGIELTAVDTGPGITAIDQAVVDGFSTTGNIGGGLGTVRRLMDDADIDPRGQGQRGVRVTARRWRGSSPASSSELSLDIGGATRPMPGYDRNGDAYLIEHGRSQTLAGVIDGLGHGDEAHRASSTAERYVQTHANDSIAHLFEGVESICQSTRGVVMALARFDWASRTVEIGAVGNINIRFCNTEGSERPISRRGVLGQGAGRPRIKTVDWQSHLVMVLHSDGVKSRWDCGGLDFHSGETASDLASDFLRELGKSDDDATVLIAREDEG